MAKKFDAKKIGLTALLGTAIVVATPFVYNFLGGISFIAPVVSFVVIPGYLDVGTIVSAGVSAFVADLAIAQWLA